MSSSSGTDVLRNKNIGQKSLGYEARVGGIISGQVMLFLGRFRQGLAREEETEITSGAVPDAKRIIAGESRVPL